ncbi:MAG TPA: BON domain-containing protein [Usitatibacter sp.]|jgi:osmotically-inducible protein OsmY|nr:BON domain-containing protein [Usitatibacter sp.]
MNNTLLRAALAAAVAATLLTGCDRDADRTLGQKLDNAVARTQTKLAEVGHKTSEELAVAGDKTKVALENAGEKTRVAVDNAGNRVEEKADSGKARAGSEASSHGMSDTAITASIKTDYLKDPDLSVLKIDVDTQGGVVTLNGLAGDEAARSRAEKLAGAIKGVREVRNFLVVKRA